MFLIYDLNICAIDDDKNLIEQLPVELDLIIFQYLTPEEILKLGQTNNKFKRIVEDNIFYLKIPAKKFKNKQKLNLPDIENNNCLDHLSNFTNLRELELINCHLNKVTLFSMFRLNNKGLWHLSNFTNLVSLDLSSCANIDDDGLKYLYNLTRIKDLYINNCINISEKGWIKYIEIQSDVINLSLCGQVSDYGFKNISILINLESLNLSQCRFTNEIFKNLSNLTNLKKLNLDYCKKLI